MIDFPEPQKPDVSIVEEGPGEYRPRRKVTVNGIEVTVIKERVQYLGDDGKIITESLRDYTRKNVLKRKKSDVAWKVKVEDLKKGFDLDVKNPNSAIEEHELGVHECLAEFRKSIERVSITLATLEKEYSAK